MNLRALFLLILAAQFARLSAQEVPISLPQVEAFADSTHWTIDGLSTFNFSQVTLKNWNGGGQSALSGTSLFNGKLTYSAHKLLFENIANLAFGLQRLETKKVVKTEDKIELLSSFGREAFGKWYYTTAVGFRSQFAKGYNYPNDSTVISKFLAPGYVSIAVGLENKVKDYFTIFVSPVSAKITIVKDTLLAAQGAFGVDKGKDIRKEYGGSMRVIFSYPIWENVRYDTRLELFSNYAEKPKNVDVNWTNLLTFKVNKYISTSISSSLVYDDDIIIKIDENNDGKLDVNGPRTQFKEIFNFGLQYQF